METNISLDLSDDLDCSWIDNFEQSEQEYACFYKEKIESVKLNYIYVDENNSINNIHQETLLLDNGKIDKDKMIEIIKNNKNRNKTNYSLISILKYNITLEPEHIKKYVNDELEDEFLSKVDILQDIYFKDTINLFQDLNCLYFIFCNKKVRENKNKITKRIMINLSSRKKNKITRKKI